MNVGDVMYPVWTGLIVTLAVSVLLLATKRWHGRFSLDSCRGPQKTNRNASPRIGGVALYAGLLAVAATAGQPVSGLLFVLVISGFFSFMIGLAEDLTKMISVTVRLLGTLLAGVTFCWITGYSISDLGIPLLDDLLGFYSISVVLTLLMMTGLTHAINIIDGFHGLACGAVVIMLSALGVLAFQSGDHELTASIAFVGMIFAVFLLFNFPSGHILLGDGGAYLAGSLLGILAIMLAVRNPEVSAWSICAILFYPALETLFSFVRKTTTRGISPVQPDALHMHHLVHDALSRKFKETPKDGQLSHPITSVVMWTGPVMGLVFVLFLPREWAVFVIVLQTLLYLTLYHHIQRSSPLYAAGRFEVNGSKPRTSSTTGR